MLGRVGYARRRQRDSASLVLHARFLESLAQRVERVKQSLFVDLVDMVLLASGNFVDAFQKEANHCIERFCVDYAVQ